MSSLNFRLYVILTATGKAPEKPANTLWVALSVASALFVVLLAFLSAFHFI